MSDEQDRRRPAEVVSAPDGPTRRGQHQPAPDAATSPESEEAAFGRVLRDIRERKGFSQRQLGALLGLDDSTVAKLEAGSRKPPRDSDGFYQRLRGAVGISGTEMATLQQAEATLRASPAVAERPEVVPHQAWGRLLRDYRERAGYSQRRLAGLLGVDDSTVAKLEAGSRKPPRDEAFYERLKGLPSITDAEILALMRTDGTLRWLLQDPARPAEEQSDQKVPGQLVAIVSAGGFHSQIHVTAEPGIATADELAILERISAAQMELVLREFQRRRVVLREAIDHALAEDRLGTPVNPPSKHGQSSEAATRNRRTGGEDP